LAASWNQVKWVVDGDTVVLVGGQKVRYIGINAPELAHDDHGAEPYGEASKKFNALLVARKKVRLEFDKERFDRYQRLLAYIFLKNATFVNAEILSNGYAYLLKHRPNLKYDEILLQAQRIKPRNRIVFQKKWDAHWAGYAPAKRCMPVFEIPGD
jgi:micrococcal nuclease